MPTSSTLSNAAGARQKRGARQHSPSGAPRAGTACWPIGPGPTCAILDDAGGGGCVSRSANKGGNIARQSGARRRLAHRGDRSNPQPLLRFGIPSRAFRRHGGGSHRECGEGCLRSFGARDAQSVRLNSLSGSARFSMGVPWRSRNVGVSRFPPRQPEPTAAYRASAIGKTTGRAPARGREHVIPSVPQ